MIDQKNVFLRSPPPADKIRGGLEALKKTLETAHANVYTNTEIANLKDHGPDALQQIKTNSQKQFNTNHALALKLARGEEPGSPSGSTVSGSPPDSAVNAATQVILNAAAVEDATARKLLGKKGGRRRTVKRAMRRVKMTRKR